MNRLEQWVAGSRWRAAVGHALVAFIMQAVVVLIAKGAAWLFPMPLLMLASAAAWLIGAALASGFYFSRERTQHQYKLKGAARTITVAREGWFPWEWERYARWEWILPTAAVISTAVAFS